MHGSFRGQRKWQKPIGGLSVVRLQRGSFVRQVLVALPITRGPPGSADGDIQDGHPKHSGLSSSVLHQGSSSSEVNRGPQVNSNFGDAWLKAWDSRLIYT